MMSNTIARMQGRPGTKVTGADWNSTVEEFREWLQEEGGEWEVVAPPTDTRFTARGISSRINFFIVNKVAKGLLQGVEVFQVEARFTPLRMHKVVSLTLLVQGSMSLEKKDTKEAHPGPKNLRTVQGICRH